MGRWEKGLLPSTKKKKKWFPWKVFILREWIELSLKKKLYKKFDYEKETHTANLRSL